MMWLLCASLSFVLDLLLGDPEKLLHPVVVMGKAISRLEKILRAGFPKTPRGERAAGFVLALLLPVGTLTVTILALWAVGLIHPTLRFALGVFWGWQALALKGLNTESKRVYTALTTGTIEDARKAVSRIVGRDTQRLDEAGVTRAAVETVAENFSDGVLAPLFYLLLGGAPLALCYKAINTMDSMIGYKNERYLYFGYCAAKLDDAANWLPLPCWGRTPKAPGASGGGTGGTTPAPTPPRRKRRWPGPWGSSWLARPGTLARSMTSPPSATQSAPWNQAIFCGPTVCSTAGACWA